MDDNFVISNFLSKNVYELNDIKMKQEILNQENLKNINTKGYSNRTIIDLKYSNQLLECYFEIKTNKKLCYLYLINYLSTNFCLLIVPIDNSYKIYSVKYRFIDHLFKGTLFECEYDNDSIEIINLLIHNGKIINIDIKSILKNINEIINYKFIPDPILDFKKLSLKSIVTFNYLRSLINGRNIDIICRFNDNVRIMIIPGPFDTKIYKEKDNLTEYLDTNKILNFKLKKTNKSDIYYLNDIYLADVSTVEISKFLKTIPDGSIVKCKFNKNFNRWTPISIV